MPTREPIEPCGNCAHRWHDKICMERVEVPFGPYCGCESRLRAPQPTAQAGEACKTCDGTGRPPVGQINYGYNCPACNGTGKVPAPPTPQPDGYYAEDGGWVDDPRAGEVRYDRSVLANEEKALIDRNFVDPHSPQLPTPELAEILSPIAGYCEPGSPMDKRIDKAVQAINQRFEAALAHHETLTGAEYVSREAARKVWYEGGTNHE
jgi:hypothetical protein